MSSVDLLEPVSYLGGGHGVKEELSSFCLRIWKYVIFNACPDIAWLRPRLARLLDCRCEEIITVEMFLTRSNKSFGETLTSGTVICKLCLFFYFFAEKHRKSIFYP
jgi:hypothetical protein